MINGVQIKNLKVIPDERGRLMEIMRNDDDCYIKFGQVYMTTTMPGVVKGFHWHKIQTDQICCVYGMIKLVLFDIREGSTKNELMEIFLGRDKPSLVTVPNHVLHGWKCVSQEEALVVNVPTETYDYKNPDEQRIHPHDENEQIKELGYAIPYNWGRRDY